MDKNLVRLTKKETEKTQITKITNDKRNITTTNLQK